MPASSVVVSLEQARKEIPSIFVWHTDGETEHFARRGSGDAV